MASSFTWLDYRAEEREDMLQLIHDLRQPEARDEMGVGRVRDRLADLLFPGTSTIQTRARYFLFIPWIYQKIQERELSGEEATRYARELEGYLISTLQQQNNTEGLIGSIAGPGVKRLASSVYWNGLYVWGIRKKPDSQREFHNNLAHYYRRRSINKLQNTSRNKDDEGLFENFRENWESTIPAMPAHFPWGQSRVQLQITLEESRFLQAMIKRYPESKRPNLLRFLVSNEIDVPETTQFPWQLPADVLDAIVQQRELHRILTHAHNFSEIIHGVRLLYNFWLAEKAVTLDIPVNANYRNRVDFWAENMMQPRLAELREWAVHLDDDFWICVGTEGIPSKTKDFIDRWVLRAVEDPFSVMDDSVWQKEIIEREHYLKRSKARLLNNDALRLWSGASGADQLEYRWSTARGFVREIVGAIKGETDASA